MKPVYNDFKNFTVREWLNWITARSDVQVFSVEVGKHDYNDEFYASSSLRGGHSYSSSGDTPEQALMNLNELLTGLFCPHCHQRLPS